MSWRDLREWIALIERNGELQRIGKPVDADEELAAITYMATRNEKALGAAVREHRRRPFRLARPRQHAGLEQGALRARGRPRSRSFDRRDDRGVAHHHEPADRAGARPEIQGAGQRGRAHAATTSTSPQFPAPKFWPGDGGRYIGTGDITLTASPDTGRINVGCYRQMLHGPRRVGLYCSPGKHGAARPRGVVEAEASPARWSPPTASIRCCSCWRRRCSAPRNPSSTSPAA